MVWRYVITFLLTPALRLWSTFLSMIIPSCRIPQPPERLLRYIFSNETLPILEYLTDVYFNFGAFWYEHKIYIVDPRVSMKIINRLDKGSHDYLVNSPLKSSLLGHSEKSPEVRHAIAATFRKSNMEHRGPAMAEVVKKTAEKMKSLKVVNVNDISLKMALDVVGKVLCGIDLKALDGEQDDLLHAMMTILHRTYALGEISATSTEFKEAAQTLDRCTRDILTRALEVQGEDRTLPQLLHTAGGFDEAADNLKLFLMAGSETTASSIPMLLYLLAEQPGLQSELQAEADDHVAAVTSDASRVPPRLESAVRELLRTYAIAPYISRQTEGEAIVLEGFTLPPESDLRIFTWGMHRSPALWTQAKDFRPHRFLANNGAKPHHPQAWMPFGAGSRVCIGQHLAWVELRVALTLLLHEVTFTKVKETRPLNFCVDWEHAVVHPDCDVILGVTPR